MNFKITLFLLLSCLMYNTAQAQTIFGAITVFTENEQDSILPHVNIELYTKETLFVSQMKSDSVGMIMFKNVPEGIYSLKADIENYKSFLLEGVIVGAGMISFVTINMQTIEAFELKKRKDMNCMYDMRNSKPKCPICNSKKEVIPYVYGLPAERLVKNEDQELYVLGGCIVRQCRPLWYCKRDKSDVEKR